MSVADASLRVGWCPGALRPMASRDGLVVRIKPRGGRLSPEQGRGVAEAAARFAAGTLELTSRANLQIRGVAEAALPALTAALDGLGLLDATADAEARRNVVASPLAGLDPAAAFDIRPTAAALEEGLAAAADLATLPAKFGFAVSDGGTLQLDDVPVDVRFDALRDTGGRRSFAARLDGDSGTAAVCPRAATAEVGLRLARLFVATLRRDPDLRRMRDLVAREGAPAVFARAGLDPCPSPLPDRPVDTVRVGPLAMPRRPGGPVAIGIAAPFGRLDAGQLRALAGAAGAADLRLTPWRAIVVAVPEARAGGLVEACTAAGFVLDPADPRLAVATCAGATGCRRGTTPTLGHAAFLARFVPPGRGIRLHVSGCAKGCAHPGPAPLTLVGRDGRYDLVAGGCLGDAPAAIGLDVGAASRLVRTLLDRDARP